MAEVGIFLPRHRVSRVDGFQTFLFLGRFLVERVASVASPKIIPRYADTGTYLLSALEVGFSIEVDCASMTSQSFVLKTMRTE